MSNEVKFKSGTHEEYEARLATEGGVDESAIYFVSKDIETENGVDFDQDEIYGMGADYDIKGKENHDISSEKIKQLTSPRGDSALQIVNYLYELLLKKNPKQEKLIKQMLSDLADMYDYINCLER